MSFFYVKCRDLNLATKYLRRLTLKGAYEGRDSDCPYRKWQCLEIRDDQNRLIWQATREEKRPMTIQEAIEALDELMEEADKMLAEARTAPQVLQEEIMSAAGRLIKLAEQLTAEIDRLEKVEGG